MPVIGISVKQLNSLLKKTLSPEELSDTLEKLGCDLEGIADIIIYRCPNCNNLLEKLSHENPPKKCNICGSQTEEEFKSIEEDKVIRLDLLPARPDLFDVGGLARALKGFIGIETGLPEYKVEKSDIEVIVHKNLSHKKSYRPYIECAVVEIPPIDEYMLRTLMKLQENLHWGIGRDRKLASIGIYDLDTLTPPFEYKAILPEEIKFSPLGMPNHTMTPKEILEKHPKGIAYAHLLEKFKAYPILIDKKEQVLSMPPIINSDETKLKIGSKNLFIDVTGITSSDVHKSLNTLVTSLVELGGKIKSVKIIHQANKNKENEIKITPDLSNKTIEININDAQKWLGIELNEKDVHNYLGKMRLIAKGKHPNYKVTYPPYRSDIKHQVDIFEDLVIAYGYENLETKLVSTLTVGEEREEEIISVKAREIMLGLGFDEIFSLMITTHDNHFTKFMLDPKKFHYAYLLNPKSADYNVVRIHLMTGLLESLVKNEGKSLPLKFFEIGNIIKINKEKKDSCIEERRLGFVIMGEKIGYAQARETMDSLLYELDININYQPYNHPSFIKGRCAKIEFKNKDLGFGYLGEIHPQVIVNFKLSYPIVVGEIPLALVIK